MKKFLAIFLTVAMLASMLAVPAMAAPGDVTIWDKPANSYTDPTNVTGKVLEINSAQAFTIKDKDTVEADEYTAVLTGSNNAKFSLGLTSDKVPAGGVIEITPNAVTPKPDAGDIVVLNVLKGSDIEATVIIQYKKAASDKVESIKIKAPTSTFVVASDTIDLELDTTATNSATTAYWFVDNAAATVKSPALGNDGASATIEGDKDVNTLTPVTVKAVSTNGLTDSITLFVVKGVPATGFKFDASNFKVKVANKAEVALSSTVTPDNGVKKELTYKVVGPTELSGTYPNYSYTKAESAVGEKDNLKFTFKLDGNKVVVAVANAADIGEKAVYPSIIVQATIQGKDQPLTDSAIVTFTKADVTTKKTVEINATPVNNRIVVGNKYQLGAVVWDDNPNYKTSEIIKDAKVKWYSSKTSVATVDEKTGVVTAVAEGKVTVIARSENANEAKIELAVVKDAAFEGKLQYVTAGKLIVRALPSSTSAKLDELKQGTVVDVLAVNGAWARISYSTTYAYVAAEYLSDPVVFTVNSSKLAVRSFPGATTAVAELVYGDVVNAIGKVSSNPAWTQIVLKDGTLAYVATKYISEGTQLGVVTSGTLTMRVGASTTSPAFANKLIKGQTVEIVGKEGAFLKVKTADGFVGYAAAGYITIL